MTSYGKPVQWSPMRSVIETPTFQKQAEKVWTEAERLEFIDWIAANPWRGM